MLVYVQVAGAFVNAAMVLMVGVVQSSGKGFLNTFEYTLRELGLALRAEADQEVVGFFFPTACVQCLYGLGFHNGQPIVVSGATGAPACEHFPP